MSENQQIVMNTEHITITHVCEDKYNDFVQKLKEEQRINIENQKKLKIGMQEYEKREINVDLY